MTAADARDVPGSSGAREVVYVDHDPLIPSHLGTDAPHVHVRSSDRCLRNEGGVECPTPEELRVRVAALEAEVERLRRRYAPLEGLRVEVGQALGVGSTAKVWRHGRLIFDGHDRSASLTVVAERDAAIVRAEAAEARLDAVRALAVPLMLREAASDRKPGPVSEHMVKMAGRLDRILDSDATASEDQPQPTSEAGMRPSPSCDDDRCGGKPPCLACDEFDARRQGVDRTDTPGGQR